MGLVDKPRIRLYTTPKQFYIGVQVDIKPSQEGFSGVVDEVCIYNRALSEEETKVLTGGLDIKNELYPIRNSTMSSMFVLGVFN